jgi:hypothetical protein
VPAEDISSARIVVDHFWERGRVCGGEFAVERRVLVSAACGDKGM